jgi:hypothetical protein
MGPGGSCGLQNRFRGANPSRVGSIPTRSRQNKIKASEVFALGAFLCLEIAGDQNRDQNAMPTNIQAV